MKITFLGTGTSQGVPVIACKCNVCQSTDFRDKRLRSSIHIQKENLSFTIDCGPDFRQQMLREEIDVLDAIVFTHEHKDHTAGLDDVRAYNFLNDMEMPLYATKRVEANLRNAFDYIFSNSKYPGVPRINFNTISNHPFFLKGQKIIPIEVLHHRLPVLGFRIDDFTYITDANYIPEKEKEKIKGSKVLVLNALRKEKHISHFTLEEAITLAEELEPEQTYFTHISHLLGKHQDVEKELPPNMNLGFDELKIIL